MASVKRSTWRSMTHSLNNYLSDFTSGVSDAFMAAAAPVNESMNEGLRDDIPANETEEERMERERQEQEEREQEAWEAEQEEMDRLEEEERAWQEEQDRILAEEAKEPGAFSKMYDAFRDSSFYTGYSGVRNMMVGGAMIGAGLGITGSAGLVTAAALPVASTAADLFRAAREKLYGEWEVLKDEEKKLMEAEAESVNGVPEDQRQTKAEPGTMEYNNIKAKEKTIDQKLAETQLDPEDMSGGSDAPEKVDPEFVKQTAEELVAGIQMEPENDFDFARG